MAKEFKKVKLGNKWIGPGEPVYFIAEIAGNFYTFEEGKRLIDSAIAAGCDCIKFQTFDPLTASGEILWSREFEGYGRVQCKGRWRSQ